MQESIYVKNTYSLHKLTADIYGFLENVPLLGKQVRLLYRNFGLIYYGDYGEAAYLTVKLLGKICAAAVISLCLLFGLNPSVYTFLTSLLIIYIFTSEFIAKDTFRLEISFLKALDEFLSNLKHYYYQDGTIREAMLDSANASGKLMKGHGMELHDCICAEDKEQALNMYMNSGYHKYLKLLLSMCMMVEENGDIRDREGSVFLNSLMQLRSDVLEDIRYKQERRHRFSGLSYTAGLPVIAVPYIALWGADTIPSLKNFYFGHTGLILKLVLFCVTFICYSGVYRLREGDVTEREEHILAGRLASVPLINLLLEHYIDRHYSRSERSAEKLKRLCKKYNVKTFMMVRLLYFAAGFAVMLFTLFFGHVESRQIIREDISDISNLSTFADGKQITAMERVIPQYTSFYIDNELIPEEENLSINLLNEPGIRTSEVALAASKEIGRRVNQYNRENLNIVDLIIALFFAFCCYFYPNVALAFSLVLSENRLQDEVLQFQSLIHMLKKVPGVSAMNILEEMEAFAGIFKPSIQQCINEYGISDREAFERLYQKEKYMGFRRIVDCFMMVDEMGIEDAFEEISSEIVNFKENRKLDRKILLDNEGMLGSLIAILPGGLIIFGYLLCPFMIRSVQIFNSYQAELAQLSE